MFELDGKKMCGICTKTLSKRAVPGQRPTSSRSGTVPAKSAKPTGTFPASGLTTGLKPVIRTDEYTPFDRTMRGVAIAGIVLGIIALLFIFIFVSSDSYSERRVARAIGGCIILIVGGIWDLLRRRQRLALLRALKLEEKQDGKTAAGVVFLIRALSGFGVFFGALLLYAGMTETAEDAQEANARLAHIIIGILFLFPCLFFMVKRYNT